MKAITLHRPWPYAIARFDGNVTELNSDWFFGPVGWLLGDVVALPAPIPCKGYQGLWNVPNELLSQLREGWRQVKQGVA